MGTTQDQDKTRGGAPTVDIDYHSGAFVSSNIPERMAAWNEVRGGCPVAWNENGDGFWLLADYPSARIQPYSVAKLAIQEFTKLWAVELGPLGATASELMTELVDPERPRYRAPSRLQHEEGATRRGPPGDR